MDMNAHAITDATTPTEPDRLLRRRKVLELVGVSEPTLWRMERAGHFPPHVQISTRAVGYFERDVLSWIAARVVRTADAA
jgi:prophage regulatory protein